MAQSGNDDSVIAKAAKILDAFSTSRPAYTVTQLARATGLTPSTAQRRADDLVRGGLLDKSEDAVYTVAPKLHRIAAAAPTGKSLTQVARPVMQDVCHATRYDVSLIVREGLQGLVVERMYGTDRMPLTYTSGESVPLHATAGGLALLAHSSRDFQNHLLDTPLAAITPHTITDPTRLRRVLADVRRQGYVVSDRASNVATIAIGAPVFGPQGEAVAGLSVVVARSHAVRRALVDTARLGALAISKGLGWRPSD